MRMPRAQVPGPTNFSKAARPAAEVEEAEPEEDTALNPVRQSTENMMTLLKPVLALPGSSGLT